MTLTRLCRWCPCWWRRRCHRYHEIPWRTMRGERLQGGRLNGPWRSRQRFWTPNQWVLAERTHEKGMRRWLGFIASRMPGLGVSQLESSKDGTVWHEFVECENSTFELFECACCSWSVQCSTRQVQYFFRSYNVTEEVANKFFDFLDEECWAAMWVFAGLNGETVKKRIRNDYRL